MRYKVFLISKDQQWVWKEPTANSSGKLIVDSAEDVNYPVHWFTFEMIEALLRYKKIVIDGEEYTLKNTQVYNENETLYMDIFMTVEEELTSYLLKEEDGVKVNEQLNRLRNQVFDLMLKWEAERKVNDSLKVKAEFLQQDVEILQKIGAILFFMFVVATIFAIMGWF